jgi:DNA-directed RNA polymerase specialized sigma24 family protein
VLQTDLLTKYAHKLSAVEDRPVSLDEARDEIQRVVYSVARQFAGKSFGSHTADDTIQTCVLYGLEALGEGTKYDPARPLDRFLYSHMRNRLSNMMRSQASRQESPCQCCSVREPPAEPCERFRKYLRANAFRKSLAKVVGLKDAAATLETPEQIALGRELDQYIRLRLDERLLKDYQRMLVDDYPHGGRLTQVRDAVREILVDSPYAEMVPASKPRKRTHKITLTWNGQTQSLSEWSEMTGLNISTLHWRRGKGWPVDRILGEPAGPTRRKTD